jgi:hypothetical protein
VEVVLDRREGHVDDGRIEGIHELREAKWLVTIACIINLSMMIYEAMTLNEYCTIPTCCYD